MPGSVRFAERSSALFLIHADVKMKFVGLVEKENFSHTRKYADFAQTREKLITKMQTDFAALQQNVARFFHAA